MILMIFFFCVQSNQIEKQNKKNSEVILALSLVISTPNYTN